MNGIIVLKVNHLDTQALKLLVEESAGEGFRHIKRMVNDFETGANTFDKEGEAIFVAYQSNDIVGICGLNQDPYLNSEEVARVRRLYVSQGVRRLGIGRMLMDSVIEEARRNYKMLVLRTDNSIADTFYRSIGFSTKYSSENYSHFLRLTFN